MDDAYQFNSEFVTVKKQQIQPYHGKLISEARVFRFGEKAAESGRCTSPFTLAYGTFILVGFDNPARLVVYSDLPFRRYMRMGIKYSDQGEFIQNAVNATLERVASPVNPHLCRKHNQCQP